MQPHLGCIWTVHSRWLPLAQDLSLFEHTHNCPSMGKPQVKRRHCQTPNGLEMLIDSPHLMDTDVCLTFLHDIRRKHNLVAQYGDGDTAPAELDFHQSEESFMRLNHFNSVKQGGPSTCTEKMKRIGHSYDSRETKFKSILKEIGGQVPWQRAIDDVEKRCAEYSQVIEGQKLRLQALIEEEKERDEECKQYACKLDNFRITLQNSRSVAERYRGKVIKVSASVTELEQASAKLASDRSKLERRAENVADEFADVAVQIEQSRGAERKEVERMKRLENLYRGFVQEQGLLTSEIEEVRTCWKGLENEIQAIATQSLQA